MADGTDIAGGAASDAAWEDPPQAPGRGRDALHLDLAGYAGPLDLLLDLARAGRVDLTALSITEVARQFGAAVEVAIARGDVPLARLGDWLVTAATLALLRSRLLLPEDSREGQEARREAALLRRQLADRAAVAALADWLTRRDQLGHEVFARGRSVEDGDRGEDRGTSPPVADLTTLLRVCLELMRRPERAAPYRPDPPDLWRPPAAIARMRRLLEQTTLRDEGETRPLTAFLPSKEVTSTSLQRRAALASTLVAGLELARDGATCLDQRRCEFSDIRRLAAQFEQGVNSDDFP